MSTPMAMEDRDIDIQAQAQAVTRGILQSAMEGKLILEVPHTDYQLHLVPSVPVASIATPPGKRIKGVIHAQSLRLFKAHGGGRFIEPMIGEPRLIAGRVLAVDEPRRRILVDVSVPMWLTLTDDQPADLFQVGDLVNGTVESGTQFTPLS